MSNLKPDRALKKKAENGSLKSAFQLYKNYAFGDGVDKDVNEAEKYAAIVIEGIQQSSIRFSSLNLSNFKGFSSLFVSFSDKSEGIDLTVFTSANGVGKSTILESVVKSMSWMSNRIVSTGSSGKPILENEIYNEEESATLISKLKLNNNMFTLDLSKSRVNSEVKKTGELLDFAELSEMFHFVNARDPGVALPILSFYSTNRAVEIVRKDISELDVSAERLSDKFLGYSKSTDGFAGFKYFYRWMKNIQDKINSAGMAEKEIFSLKVRIEKLHDEIKLLKVSLGDQANQSGTLPKLVNKLLDQSQEEYAELQEKLNLADSDVFVRNISVVNYAISQFLPDFNNCRIQYAPEVDMVIDKNGKTLSVLQLSQGEKSLIALVADISRRLVLLNPASLSPLEGGGVVVIDEVDLHLHPGWQQMIVPRLVSVFPNIQFLLSTHSPQVLSTVRKKHIQILSVNQDGEGESTAPLSYTYGELSSNVLHEVMHIDPYAQLPELGIIDKLTVMVEQGDFSSKEFLNLFTEAQDKLSPAHPRIKKMQNDIKRYQLLRK